MVNLSEDSLNEAFKDDAKLKIISQQIAKDIEDQKNGVAQWIEKLGFALRSPSVELRLNGFKVFSGTIACLPKNLLTEGQLEFIVIFFTDGLKDHLNIIPAVLDGILALIQMDNLPERLVETLVVSILQQVSCQAHTRYDREKIFKILKILTEKFENVLKAMKADFISGLLNQLDGERDPRNLLLIFSFMPAVIERYPLMHFSEDMFEVFACYFPIDFTPKKDDPSAITREILAKTLADCLVATEEFIQWTIPLALEKLNSDLIVAKINSLEVMSLAMEKYPPKVLEPYFNEIWRALKLEIFPGSGNEEITNAGLKTLRSMLDSASKESSISHDYQTIILGTILPHLNDLNHRLFDPSTAIALVCVSSDIEFVTQKILNSFLLKLHNIDEPLQAQDKIKIFQILTQIFKICVLKKGLTKINSELLDKLHKEFIAEIKREKNPKELRALSVACLNQSLAAVGEANRALLYQSMIQLLTDSDSDIDLSDILRHTAELYPIELQSHCVDACFKNFPLFSEFVKKKLYRNFLHLVSHKAFSRRVYDLIFTNIFINPCPNVKLIALDALIALLQQNDEEFIERIHMNESVVEKTVDLMKTSIGSVILERCARVLSLVIKCLPLSEQYIIISTYAPVADIKIESDLFLIKGILESMHQDISINKEFERLVNDLCNLSLQNDDQQSQDIANRLLCSLFNKVTYCEDTVNVLNNIVTQLKNEINNNNQKAVTILSWIGKGLIVRGHKTASEIIETVVQLLDRPSLGTSAQCAIEIISAEYPELHLPVATLLYKQRFFTLVFTQIGDKLECFSENHLNAFVRVLKVTPHTVLTMNLEKVGPILFKCLELPDTNTIITALEICEQFVKTKDAYFSGHLTHLAAQCIRLSQFKGSMKVRAQALSLLYEMTKYASYLLLPLKTDVILDLIPALNDNKRFVRSMAVKARNAWFLVGEPNGS